MNKTIVNVPSDIKYMSEWKDFKLLNYPHILDKQITGCGFTEYCIRSSENIVLCSPRKILLENKEAQHTNNVLYVRNEYDKSLNVDIDLNAPFDKNVVNPMKNPLDLTDDVSLAKKESHYDNLRQQIRDWVSDCISKNLPSKILVTYDSFGIVKEVLEELSVFKDFHTVIDEFQSIFTDSKFKSDTEMGFLNHLKGVSKICFVSATPMIEDYLDMLDEFKDLPYFRLDWGSLQPNRIIKPTLTVRKTRSIVSNALEIIEKYKSGEFERSVINDNTGNLKEVFSTEVVFYVNSVKNITSIVKRAGLKADEVNILCANTIENAKRLKTSLKMIVGKVPLKGEPRKMFTFCTRTVYLGADFYSDNARTVILSDANISSLAVDITLDLPQIMGRQRLEENPWKNKATLFYKTICEPNKIMSEVFEEFIKLKKHETGNLLQALKDSSTLEIKGSLSRVYKGHAKSYKYKSDYVAVNEDYLTGLLKPVFNNLVMISEKRAFEVQQVDYADRFSVMNRVMIDNQVDADVQKFLYKFEGLSQFPDKMKLLCETKLDKSVMDMILEQVPVEYKTFYLTIPLEKIKGYGYKKYQLEKLSAASVHKLIDDEIYLTFFEGDIYPFTKIKEILKNLYIKCEIKKVPKATDLLEYFQVKSHTVYEKISKKETKKSNGYKLIKRLK